MKSPFIIAAILFAAVVALGFMPTDTPTQADPIAAIDMQGSVITYDLAESPDSTVWLTNSEPALTEFDTSVPAEEPTQAEPEQPDTSSAANASCPETAKSTNASRSVGGRDWVLFDGDGYLVDRRGAASAGDGGRFPVLRRILGVDRRQNRRAAGCGLFGCRR